MIDSVIAGTGNSRYLRTSLPDDTTWEDALTMLRAGTFPIDLAGINQSGFSTLGTALNSATLLKDAVCTALGLSTNATPSDAWEAVIALIDSVDETVVTVSGTNPVITGEANHRYMCGEVSTISITPPQTGSIEVIFTSGTQVAVLTVPNTVMFPENFDPSSLNTDTIYDILIMDGIYGGVMKWEA